MNSKHSILAAILAVLTLTTSCLSDNSTDVTYYNDAAITSFSLATLKRIMHTKSKAGQDSTYETTVSCSGYAFTIDQEQGLIYNLDSLPVGTCTDKSLVTISTYNSSYVYLKSFTSDSVSYYSSSTDSLDFSQKRILKVVSTDGMYIKDYTVDVRVHKETSDSLYWDERIVSPELSSLEGMRSLTFGKNIIAYGVSADNTAKAYTTTTDDGKTWKEVVLPSESPVTMVATTNALYALCEGKIYSTAGVSASFSLVSENSDLKALVAASRSELYAFSNDNKIMKSVNGGVEWTVDETNDDLANLPAQDIQGICTVTKTNPDIDKVILIGNRAEVMDSCCVVWSKVVDNGNPAATEKWMYQPFYSYQWHNGPALANLSVAAYNDGILMIGGEGLGTCKEESHSAFFFSRDNGQNWWKDSRFYFPEGFDTSKTSFSIVSDSSNHLWILCGGTGQVWRGHLSQLTWE